MRNHRSLLKSGWEAISAANGNNRFPYGNAGNQRLARCCPERR